jgi:hypothetical protein
MTNKTEVTTQKTKTMKVESRETDNIRDKTPNEDKQQKLQHRKLKQWRKNPETQITLDTRHRTKTNKTEVPTQKAKTMKEESRDTENIRHKTQNEDKQNRSYNTEN